MAASSFAKRLELALFTVRGGLKVDFKFSRPKLYHYRIPRSFQWIFFGNDPTYDITLSSHRMLSSRFKNVDNESN